MLGEILLLLNGRQITPAATEAGKGLLVPMSRYGKITAHRDEEKDLKETQTMDRRNCDISRVTRSEHRFFGTISFNAPCGNTRFQMAI